MISQSRLDEPKRTRTALHAGKGLLGPEMVSGRPRVSGHVQSARGLHPSESSERFPPKHTHLVELLHVIAEVAVRVPELIQELMSQETLFDIADSIEKLFSKIENTNKEKWKENQKAQMLMKTGKGWVDVGKPAIANKFLDIALHDLEKYDQLNKDCSNEAEANMHKAGIQKDIFKVLSYQAESAVALADFQKAVTCVQRCKEILIRLPKEVCYLSLLCYNFGIETYEFKIYEQSSFWLSLSYEIGKMHKNSSISKEMQAKVLRLLATVYLEWDYKQYQEKALQAIIMANEENLHPAGFYLKIKILLKGDASDEDIRKAVTELLQHEVSLEICLDTAKLLLEHKREAIGFDFLKSASQLFERSPDAGRVLLFHIELLLQRTKEPLAKGMIEDAIAGLAHSAGKQLPPEILSRLHLVLWDRAAKNYEVCPLTTSEQSQRILFNSKSYLEALQWYNYSLSFYASGQTEQQNLAKLYRNMAACYLHLKEPGKANEAVKKAERYDPNSIFTHFYVYKIAVLEKNTLKAWDAFVAMEKSAAEFMEGKLLTEGSMATNLLSLAAQFALEVEQDPIEVILFIFILLIKVLPLQNDQQDMAIKALGYLSQHLQDCQQALTAVKIKDMESLLSYLTAGIKLARSLGPLTKSGARAASLPAHRRLDELHKEETELLEIRASEAQWFRKIAVLLAQRTCLLMAAAVDLEISRSNLLPADEAELLTQALEYIQSCRAIWKVLKQTGDFPKDPTDTILQLYEFEASAKLNSPAVSGLLDEVLALPQVEIKTLETIASLAMESPAHYPSVCKRALRRILTLLRKGESVDTAAYSKCLHSLVHLSLPSGPIEADLCVLEEAWAYFEDALNVLDNRVSIMQLLWMTGLLKDIHLACPQVLQAGYPEVEIIWLMTRAWNTGIYHYCAGKYKEAEQWCGLGMRFLAYLGTLKNSYENQVRMISVYGEVLDKLDKAKRPHSKEE
ncbi:Testis-expressed sequence 11 protein, partial [Ophiophagus hannah]